MKGNFNVERKKKTKWKFIDPSGAMFTFMRLAWVWKEGTGKRRDPEGSENNGVHFFAFTA